MNKVIDMLNVAFESDPQAIHALMCNRVPCSTSLMYDEHVIVDANRAISEEAFTVGTLGIINGIMSCLGLPNVAMKWSNETPNKFLGFCEYEKV